MTQQSRPDNWLDPRPYSDPSLRRMKHGPLLPMEPVHGLRFWKGLFSGLVLTFGFFAVLFLFAAMTP